MADGDEEEISGEEQVGDKKKSPLKLIIIVVVVLAIAGGAGAFFMMGDKSTDGVATNEAGETDAESGDAEDAEGEASAGEAYYFSLDPPFIVNFTGKSRARFLQVSIEGLTRDESVKESITKHFPQVRNNLVLLLSGQTYEELNTQEGKATLRKQVLKEVQKVLEAETGKEGVEDVYFTSFVMQ